MVFEITHTSFFSVSYRLVMVFTLAILLLISNSGIAQDPHLSQYYTSPSLINPGAIGTFEGKTRLALNYRNQWTTVNSNYQTTAASFETSFKKKRRGGNYLGVGVNVLSDKAGVGALKRLAFNLGGAYHLQMDEHTIGLGLQTGFVQKSIDLGALTWETQYNGYEYDANLDSQEKFSSQVGFLDFGAGVDWRYEISKSANVNIGAGIFHLSQPLENFDIDNRNEALPLKIITHGLGQFASSGSPFAYFPHFMVAFQGPSKEITAGMNLRYMLKESSKYTGMIKGNAVFFGADYRFGDAVIMFLGLELSDWELGISYDINTSGFNVATGGVGGIELSLVWVKAD